MLQRIFGNRFENFKGFFYRFPFIGCPGTPGCDNFALFIKNSDIKKLLSFQISLEKTEIFHIF
jgi:hypothetical protein